MGDGRLAGRRAEEGGPVIAGAQPAQGEVVRPEVIETSRQPGEVAADEVEFDVIEGAGAGRGAKVDIPALALAVAGDPRAEMEDLRNDRQVRDPVKATTLALGE